MTCKSRCTWTIPWADTGGWIGLCCDIVSQELWQCDLYQRCMWDLPPGDGTEAPRIDSASGWTTCQRSRTWSSLRKETNDSRLNSNSFIRQSTATQNPTETWQISLTMGPFECSERVKEPRSHGYCPTKTRLGEGLFISADSAPFPSRQPYPWWQAIQKAWKNKWSVEDGNEGTPRSSGALGGMGINRIMERNSTPGVSCCRAPWHPASARHEPFGGIAVKNACDCLFDCHICIIQSLKRNLNKVLH